MPFRDEKLFGETLNDILVKTWDKWGQCISNIEYNRSGKQNRINDRNYGTEKDYDNGPSWRKT